MRNLTLVIEWRGEGQDGAYHAEFIPDGKADNPLAVLNIRNLNQLEKELHSLTETYLHDMDTNVPARRY